MKGTGSRKLRLGRETVRAISNAKLARAAGGWKVSLEVDYACSGGTCADTCYSCYATKCDCYVETDTCGTRCDCVK